ncbi:MAG: Dabb family protein [Planctomycetota bacterium]
MPSSLPALAVPLLLTLALSSCAVIGSHTVAGSGKLVHVVVFWLKSDSPADVVERMRTFYLTRVAGHVVGVESVWFGKPRPSERSVVDDSFACTSIVRFRDAAAEAGWQRDPVHDEFKRQFEAHFERVQVYDLVE